MSVERDGILKSIELIGDYSKKKQVKIREKQVPNPAQTRPGCRCAPVRVRTRRNSFASRGAGQNHRAGYANRWAA